MGAVARCKKDIWAAKQAGTRPRPGGCIPHFVGSGSLAVCIGPRLADLMATPEELEWAGVTQAVGTELQDGFAGGTAPEFFA